MAQWINLQQIKKFVNLTPLCIACEKSGGLHLAEPGLTAGRQANRQNWARLEIFKLAIDQNIRFFTLFSQGTALF